MVIKMNNRSITVPELITHMITLGYNFRQQNRQAIISYEEIDYPYTQDLNEITIHDLMRIKTILACDYRDVFQNREKPKKSIFSWFE
jgi:hypothetical protein